MVAAAAAATMEEAHEAGSCRPCWFFHNTDRGGCKQGDACDFCHLCPPKYCKFFNGTDRGGCKHGDACRFCHLRPPLRWRPSIARRGEEAREKEEDAAARGDARDAASPDRGSANVDQASRPDSRCGPRSALLKKFQGSQSAGAEKEGCGPEPWQRPRREEGWWCSSNDLRKVASPAKAVSRDGAAPVRIITRDLQSTTGKTPEGAAGEREQQAPPLPAPLPEPTWGGRWSDDDAATKALEYLIGSWGTQGLQLKAHVDFELALDCQEGARLVARMWGMKRQMGDFQVQKRNVVKRQGGHILLLGWSLTDINSEHAAWTCWQDTLTPDWIWARDSLGSHFG